MPFKERERLLEWSRNRVHSNQKGKKINLNGIKMRTYVCELCGSVWITHFHEYNHNPKNVIEVCEECHYEIHNEIFKEDKIK